MKIGDLVRYTVWSSQLHNMLGIITDISPAPIGGTIAHALVTFQNGEEHWTNMTALEVL